MEAISSDTAAVERATGHLRAVEDRGALQLASAAAVVARAEQDIDLIWRVAVAGGDTDLSERLVELSHALHRAARGLDRSARAIG